MKESDDYSIRIMALTVGVIVFFLGGISITYAVGIIVGLPIFLMGILPSAWIYSIVQGSNSNKIIIIAAIIFILCLCFLLSLVYWLSLQEL